MFNQRKAEGVFSTLRALRRGARLPRTVLATAFALTLLIVGGAVIQPARAQTFTVLHSFSVTDGGTPLAGLTMDAAGNLYGTTSGGGAHGAGTVFKLDPSGQEALLYSFAGGADGGTPQSDLIIDAAGNLYGTTTFGGNACYGTVFKLDTTGHESVLHCFSYFPDGSGPDSRLVLNAAGKLYGVTPDGGAHLEGILFSLNPLNAETVLHSFLGPPNDGAGPKGIAVDKGGNVYGTTIYGGSSTVCLGGCGAVFKFDVHGAESVVHIFTNGADGAFPWAGPIIDAAGNIYGTTSQGGVTAACPAGCGTVFKVDTSSHESVLYSFKGGTDGKFPQASLAIDAIGNLYGTTLNGGDTSVNNGAGYGTVFKLEPSGAETVLYRFTGSADGRLPKSDLLLDAAGNIYGTTQSGGANGAGTVFEISVPSQQALPNVMVYLDSLQSQGILNFGQHNSLIKQLQKAVDMWNAGKGKGAAGNLQNFISEVNDLSSSGILSPAQAGALITGAKSVFVYLEFDGQYANIVQASDGYVHFENDSVTGLSVSGSHTFTNGTVTGSFTWSGTISVSASFASTATISGTGVIQNQGTRPFVVTGDIAVNPDGSGVLNWGGMDPVFGPIGGIAYRPYSGNDQPCLAACQTAYNESVTDCMQYNDPSICGTNTTCQATVQANQDSCIANAGNALNECVASCTQ